MRRWNLDTLVSKHRESAALPHRRDTKLRAGLCPGDQSLFSAAARIKPFEVFLAGLDQMGQRNFVFHEGRHRIAIWGHERTDVRVEADCRLRARRSQRGKNRLRMAGVDGGDRTDVQVMGGAWPFGRKRPWAVVGGRVEVERI